MKKILLIPVLWVFILVSVMSQASQAFKYQAIARDINGYPIINKTISLKINIVSGSKEGLSEYSEVHQATTNDIGLVIIEIGNGKAVYGKFSSINWGETNHYVQIALDENGGNDYKIMGTAQLLSVPYALYANKAGEIENSQPKLKSGTIMYWTASGSNIYNDNTGNVGIGEAYPVAKLELATNKWLMFKSSGTAGINFYETGVKTATSVQYGATIYFDQSNGVFIIGSRQNNNTNKAITIGRQNGYVGIGNGFTDQNSIPRPLSVYGSSLFSDDITLRDGALTSGNILVNIYDQTDDGAVDIYRNNSADIHLNGNGTSYINNSDLAIGTTTPASSAKLDVSSTTKGFLMPRLTCAQRDAISSPAEGLMIYNSELKCINYFNGSNWLTID